MRTNHTQKAINHLQERALLQHLQHNALTRIGDRLIHQHELRSFLQLNRFQPTLLAAPVETHDPPPDSLERAKLEDVPNDVPQPWETTDWHAARWRFSERDEYASLPQSAHDLALSGAVPIVLAAVERSSQSGRERHRWTFPLAAERATNVGVITRTEAESLLAEHAHDAARITALMRTRNGECHVAALTLPEALAEVGLGVRSSNVPELAVRYECLVDCVVAIGARDGILRFGTSQQHPQ